MKEIYCPNCHRMLFKAQLAEVEIKCPKCGTLVKIFHYLQSRLLTIDQDHDKIKASSSSETIES